MTVENQVVDGHIICKVSGALSIWEVAETWKRIFPLLASKETLEFDFSQVEQCDGSGIQILCQIKRAIEQSPKDISVSSLSEPVKSAMQQAGLNQESLIKPLEGI